MSCYGGYFWIRLLPEGVYCDEKAWRANETFDGLQLCAGPLYCNG